MNGLVLDYRSFSPFYYIRLIYWPSYSRLKNEKIFRLFSVIFGLHPPGHLAGNKQTIINTEFTFIYDNRDSDKSCDHWTLL